MGWILKLVSFGGFGLKWANPVVGVAITVFQWLVSLAKTIVKGTFSFLHTPSETIAVAFLVSVGVMFGIHIGIKWDAHLVKGYKAQLVSIQAAGVSHDSKDAKRAAAAIKKGEEAAAAKRAELAAEAAKAKAALTLIPLPAPVAVPSSVSVGKPDRVRNRAKRVRPVQSEPGVLGDIQADIAKLYGVK